jgi:hypothetical protein
MEHPPNPSIAIVLLPLLKLLPMLVTLVNTKRPSFVPSHWTEWDWKAPTFVSMMRNATPMMFVKVAFVLLDGLDSDANFQSKSMTFWTMTTIPTIPIK